MDCFQFLLKLKKQLTMSSLEVNCHKNQFQQFLYHTPHRPAHKSFDICCCHTEREMEIHFFSLYRPQLTEQHTLVFTVLSSLFGACFLLKSISSGSTLMSWGRIRNLPVQCGPCRALTHSEHSARTLWSPAILNALSKQKMKINGALWVMSKQRLLCLWCLKSGWNTAMTDEVQVL